MPNINQSYGVFQDKKGRNVYINRYHKNAYIIQDKDERKFNLYANRFIMPFLVIAAFMTFDLPIYYGIFGGVFAWAILMYMFHKKFLPSLSQIEKVELKEKYSYTKKLASTNEPNKLLIKFIVFALIGVLLPLNAYVSQMSQSLIYISAFAGIAVIMYACGHLLAFIQSRKQ